MAINSKLEQLSSTSDQRQITILGSTGSVGCQTIDIIRRNYNRYKIEALTAGSNVELLAEQAKELKPSFVAIADPKGGSKFKR